MERLKSMKETLMNYIQGQMTNLESVDTKELGEAIDMIKDLSEAIYYCTITEAMEGKNKEGHGKEYHYYTERYMPIKQMKYPERDKERIYYNGDYGYGYYPPIYYYDDGNMMYYNGNGNGNSNDQNGSSSASMNGNNASGYWEQEMPRMMRDEREGRSPMSRKSYMETKEMHQDKNVKLKELEKYMQELSTDMVEMIQGASPEEKQLLEKRISALATKIGQVNV